MVVAVEDSLKEGQKKVYDALSNNQDDRLYYRKDIGFKAFNYLGEEKERAD